MSHVQSHHASPQLSGSETSAQADNCAAQGSDDQTIPPATKAALGAVGEDVLNLTRQRILPAETNEVSAVESLKEIITFIRDAPTRTARISDNGTYARVSRLVTEASTRASTIDDFAAKYWDPQGTDGKALLLLSIQELFSGLCERYVELRELIVSSETRENVPPTFDPPALCNSVKCEVLSKAKGGVKWAAGESIPIGIEPADSSYVIAQIVSHSGGVDPHAHLLVDSHAIVSSEGLLTPISVPTPNSSLENSSGGLSITLRIDGRVTADKAPQVPQFSITTVRYVRTINEGIQSSEAQGTMKPGSAESADRPLSEITYKLNLLSERVSSFSWTIPKAELCVPEIFTKLFKKFDETSFSDEDKAQLVAQAFCSQRLIYKRDGELADLLSVCNPKHRLSLILGLGMGDCKLLSAALQQLIAHAGLKSVIEAGAHCSPDGTTYQRPWHARVKVYCSDSILRLDPTVWCVQNTPLRPLTQEEMNSFRESLRGDDAAACYQVGETVRSLLTATDRDAPNRENALGDGLREGQSAQRPSNVRYPHHHHRLKDDLRDRSKMELYLLLASHEQDTLVAELWASYQKLIESVRFEGDRGFVCNGPALLSDKTIANLAQEVELVGLEGSRLCVLLPQMMQTICGTYLWVDCFNDFNYFIDQIASIDVRTALLARTLSVSTFVECAWALAEHPELSTSDESARFLTRLLLLLGEYPHDFGVDEDPMFHKDITLLAAQFERPQRDAIVHAHATIVSTDSSSAAVSLLGGSKLYSPDRFPKEIIATMFPEFTHEPVQLATKLFDAQRDNDSIGINEKLIAILIICQYFDPHIYAELKLHVTQCVTICLTKHDAKGVNFSGNPAVSALCDLVYLDARKPPVEGMNFVDLRKCFPVTHSEHQPVKRTNKNQDFLRGYILKQLADLGLLDLDRIGSSLYNPNHAQIRATFDSLQIASPTIPSRKHHDSQKTRKAAEIFLATLIECNSKDRPFPHAELLKEVESSSLVDQGTLDLMKIVLNRHGRQFDKELPTKAIPDTVSYLFNIKDSLRLRSYVRVRAACSVLERAARPHNAQGTSHEESNTRHAVEEALLQPLQPSDRTMARLYLDTDSCLLIADSEGDDLNSNSSPAPIAISSMRTLRSLVEDTRRFIDEQEPCSGRRQRARQIVTSLLNQFTPEAPKSHMRSPSNRAPTRLWRDAVAQSVRLQRTEGGKRILRQISESRNENLDSNREYRPGDDLRKVNWRASARCDGLISRTFQSSSQSIADSYHVVIDLADLICSPQLDLVPDDEAEFVIWSVTTNTQMLGAVCQFLNSLVSEERRVHVSLFAYGSIVSESEIPDRTASPSERWQRLAVAMQSLSEYAERYRLFCVSTQCVPDAYSVIGLMNSDESAHYRQQIGPRGLVLHLCSERRASTLVDPFLRELVTTGRAAQVFM